jgi:hypothetical protein
VNKRYLFEYWRAVVVIFGSFVSLVLLVVSLIGGFRSMMHESTFDRERADLLTQRDEEAQKRLQDDETAFVHDIVAQIKSLQKNETGSGSGMSLADRAALAQVVESQKQLSARLSALEGALMNEPAKALAVPLLKKDVDDVLNREKSDASDVRGQDERLDRLMSQVLTTTVAVLAFVVSAIVGLFGVWKAVSASNKNASSDKPAQ